MQCESTSSQLELARNASTQTHKLLMNYLSNSTGICIRLRQHPQLKSCTPLPPYSQGSWNRSEISSCKYGQRGETHAFCLWLRGCAGKQMGLLHCTPMPPNVRLLPSHHRFCACECMTAPPQISQRTAFSSLSQHPCATAPCSRLSWIFPPSFAQRCAESRLPIPL